MALQLEYNRMTGFVGLVVLYVVWRFWRFTIQPRLQKNVPTLIPYPVPWFGHIVGFFRDGGALITASRQRYAPNREPFTIHVCGQNIYIVTAAKDTTAVFRNVADLTFNAYVRDVMLRFGASPSGLDSMWVKPSPEFVKKRAEKGGFPNPNAKPLIHSCEDVFKAFLHPGAEMEVLQSRLVEDLHQRLSWDGMPKSAVLKEENKGLVRTVSLKTWLETAMLEASTKAFFGEAILKIEPTLLETFSSFDRNSWKFSYALPRVFAKQVYEEKEKLQAAFKKYAQTPLSERDDASGLVKTMEAEMRAVGMGDDDIGAYLVLLYWPIQGNPWKVCFWFMAHLLRNPSIKARIAAEVLPIIHHQPPLSPGEMSKKLLDCTYLTAAYHEGLRVTSSTMTIRDVANDCFIGGKLLQKGSRVLVPYRQMFTDEKVFGDDVLAFRPERFYDNPALAKHPGFRPFGGGVTYCPGRFIAQREIFSVVAILVAQLEVELVDPEAPFPLADEKKPGLGTTFPDEHADELVRIRRR